MSSRLLREIAKRKRYLYIAQNLISDYDELGITISEYRTALEDPHTYAAFKQRTGQIAQMGWELKDIEKEKEFKSETMGFLSNWRMTDIIYNILESVLFGFTVFEIMWERHEGKLLPVKLCAKPIEWFKFNEDRELVFISDSNGVIKLPKYKFLVIQHNPTYLNPYGEKVIKKIYQWVKQKHITMEMWQKLIERYGMPSIVGRYPTGATPEEQAELLSQLEDMVDDNITVMEEGDTFEFPESAKYNVGEVFQKLMHAYNLEISKALLTVTLTTELTQIGSYKTALIHKEMLEYIGLSDKKTVEGAINDILEWYTILNYGPDHVKPKVKFNRKENIIEGSVERDKILDDMGIEFTEEYFMKRYNLTKEDFVIKKNEEK